MDHMNVVHYFRRPCLRLIDTYRQSWKPTHNHFERYSDVRPKGEQTASKKSQVGRLQVQVVPDSACSSFCYCRFLEKLLSAVSTEIDNRKGKKYRI